jgi:hypothetical protein
MTRLRRLAAAASLAALLLGVLLPVATTAAVLTSPDLSLFAPLGFSSLEHVPAATRALARGLALGPAFVAGAALVLLARGLRRVREGHLFSEGLAWALSRFAAGIALASATSLVLPTVTGLLFSVGAAPGEGRLVLSLGSPAAFGLVVALTVHLLARLLVEAQRLERENAEFV